MSSASFVWDKVCDAPPQGWIIELEEAKAAASREPPGADATALREVATVNFRIAKAYYKLRRWKKCKAAATLALTGTLSRKDTKILHRCIQICDVHLSVWTAVEHDEVAAKLLKGVLTGEYNINRTPTPHGTFRNSNALQFAALSGDIRYLEEIVARGAALDYPFLSCSTVMIVAPTDATALVLLCALLAIHCDIETRDAHSPTSRLLQVEVKKLLECAVQLVRLGADFNKRLHLPSPSPNNARQIEQLRTCRLDGLSAREMAVRSRKHELVDIMNDFSNEEIKLAKAHCRCGSRLPWQQCHGGGFGEVPVYIRGSTRYFNRDGSNILWRLSPLARCPCCHTKKTYYSCCWYQTPDPKYLDDSTARLELAATDHVDVTPVSRAMVKALKTLMPTNAATPDHNHLWAETIRILKADWPSTRKELWEKYGSKCKIQDWDPNVYGGCLERLRRWFSWTDLHWGVEKAELLERTKEWNEALEKYCDDLNITGEERDAVIQKHKASPMAPCGNPDCDAYEQSVKEFQRCSGCRKISYCSRSCQKGHWKKHKQLCCM